MQTSDEIDQMVSEFAGDVKGTIRYQFVPSFVPVAGYDCVAVIRKIL